MSSQELTQTFLNKTERDQIIFLEPCVQTFRLKPKQKLILKYQSDDRQNEHNSALQVDFMEDQGTMWIVIWTHEDQMFNPDGSPASPE